MAGASRERRDADNWTRGLRIQWEAERSGGYADCQRQSLKNNPLVITGLAAPLCEIKRNGVPQWCRTSVKKARKQK